MSTIPNASIVNLLPPEIYSIILELKMKDIFFIVFVTEDGEYMSFGISGVVDHTQMVGGDVAVAWVDKDTLKGYANDYYLDAKSQCAGVHGSCPDERIAVSSIIILDFIYCLIQPVTYCHCWT